MKTLKYSNNDEMPALGLGTWKSAPGEVYNAVKIAIKAGYRHIDCAPIYGNEKEIGQALTECFNEGIVSRSELWITSKLWNNAHAKADVIPALQQTLADLQIVYLDLFLIHWPVAIKKEVGFPQSADDMLSLDKVSIAETWSSMEEAVSLNLVKHIGVSNFGKKRLADLMAMAKIKPEMNQVESHPYFQQDDLLSFCKSNNIHFTAYSPLGSFDRPEAFKAPNEPKLLADELITEIAQSKNVSTAQVLISWALNRGIAVIPKSVNASRITQNLMAESIVLSEEEMNSISKLEKNFRYVLGDFWIFDGGPYTLEELWA